VPYKNLELRRAGQRRRRAANLEKFNADSRKRGAKYRDRHHMTARYKGLAHERYARRQKNNYHVLNRYGLTKERYADMLISQSGRCSICERPMGPTKAEGPHVDHNHLTDLVRELLCMRCNTVLGAFLESTSKMYAAIAYLLRWERYGVKNTKRARMAINAGNARNTQGDQPRPPDVQENPKPV
jgi:hypothetical protein